MSVIYRCDRCDTKVESAKELRTITIGPKPQVLAIATAREYEVCERCVTHIARELEPLAQETPWSEQVLDQARDIAKTFIKFAERGGFQAHSAGATDSLETALTFFKGVDR